MKALALRLLVPAAIALLALEAAPLYGALTADGRMSPALRLQLRQDLPAYSVRVTFPFRPEFFHINKLQQIGTVAGVEGRRVRVVQLTAAQVRAIAGFYWVKQVDVLEGAP